MADEAPEPRLDLTDPEGTAASVRAWLNHENTRNDHTADELMHMVAGMRAGAAAWSDRDDATPENVTHAELAEAVNVKVMRSGPPSDQMLAALGLQRSDITPEAVAAYGRYAAEEDAKLADRVRAVAGAFESLIEIIAGKDADAKPHGDSCACGDDGRMYTVGVGREARADEQDSKAVVLSPYPHVLVELRPVAESPLSAEVPPGMPADALAVHIQASNLPLPIDQILRAALDGIRMSDAKSAREAAEADDLSAKWAQIVLAESADSE